jgi:hypothetical protein
VTPGARTTKETTMPAEWTPDRTPDAYRTPARAKAALARADAMVAAVMAENAMLQARIDQLEEMHEGLLRRFVDPHLQPCGA